MKGEIGTDGCLKVERAGEMKQQICPFGKGDPFCGDWCPLFGEPWEPILKVIYLKVCQGREFVFSDLKDERKSSNETRLFSQRGHSFKNKWLC